MPLFRLLLVLFIAFPLLELYLLIKVGGMIGVLPTIGLCILTAVLGAALLRLQGLQTLADIQSRLERREMPAAELLSGTILLLSGALLLTPGFVTDCIGFLCLVPALREKLAGRLLLRLLKERMRNGDVNIIVEGEFWSENEDRDNKKLR